MCQKCYLLMTISIKLKTPSKLILFFKWETHSTNSQICEKMTLLQKWIIGTQKLKSQKIRLGRRVNSNIWTQSALETLKKITRPDFLPKNLTLRDFTTDTNPPLPRCVCGICEKLLRKLLMMKSCQHVFCFICLSSFLKSKPEDSTFCQTCNTQFSINDASHTLHSYL